MILAKIRIKVKVGYEHRLWKIVFGNQKIVQEI
ncbi:MAG: hypothetical protein UR78_C0004G0051 [Candidatus Moranbacteria bacterium GW2011_GWF2_35_39]|nr:MAG: hypothetical protein UR78_C0004G0051 [Candidatus Moranbacteria bacterium GW2011_GWF2_35_39]